jgi:membrane-bound lytic murein transglycosylase D
MKLRLKAPGAILVFLVSGGLAAQTLGDVSRPASLTVEAYPEVTSGPIAGPATESGRPLRQTGFRDPPVTPPPEGPYAGTGQWTPSIPGLEEELTQQYIRQYSSSGGLSWLQSVIRRGAPYLHFIRQKVAERNLPPELVSLPVIESSYLATAVSRSGAVGLWQFMRNSIAPFDIHVTEWMDERIDFWKSTEGALAKLQDNYRSLEDWPLALAAYNAGLGGVRRIIQQTGIRDYWQLANEKRLKTETAHYLPKLLAVSFILSNPRRFGLDLDWSEDPQWTRVQVNKQVDLEILAREAGINEAELKEANRELVYAITPPTGVYYLKVPSADSAAVAAVLARTDLVMIRYYYHTIRYGDTLSALAQHYGVSVDQIDSANPGVQARFLKIGQRLRIPALRDAEPYAARQAAGAGASSFGGTHLVKRGETLWSIALAYAVDPEVLAEANGMGLNDTLREGRVLKTPIR